jgi:hypothetical protein
MFRYTLGYVRYALSALNVMAFGICGRTLN